MPSRSLKIVEAKLAALPRFLSTLKNLFGIRVTLFLSSVSPSQNLRQSERYLQ